MIEFDRTILIKLNKVWQPAEASITEFSDGTDEIVYKLNGVAYHLPAGQKDWQYQKYGRLLTEEEKIAAASEMNVWELRCVLDRERKQEENLRYHRLNLYRADIAARNANANH